MLRSVSYLLNNGPNMQTGSWWVDLLCRRVNHTNLTSMKNQLSYFFLSLLLPVMSFAQEVVVKGKVVDTDSMPLIGVTVMETGKEASKGSGKGSGRVTVTDANGRFEIKASSKNATLAFSYVGYKTKRVELDGRFFLDVTLISDITEIDGVVVIGYGTSRRSDLTGSITSIRSQALEDDHSTSLTGILAGRIPGVHAVSTGGAPGAQTSIIVRGASSVSGGTAPLYVIDGVMMGGSSDEVSAASRIGDGAIDPMSLLNPDDIASIEVLKDASATAIYGSRGANGVIIVTTKSGAVNKAPEVRFSYDFALDVEPKQIEMLNGYDYENYMALRNPFQRYEDGSLQESCEPWWNEDGTVKHSGKSNNWQDYILRAAITHNANASIRGGAKNLSYAVSAGYLDKEGIATGSDMSRFTFSSKLNVNVKRWFRMGIDLKGSQTENNGIVSADRYVANNVFAQMLIYSPIRDVDDVSASTNDGDNPRNNPVVNADRAIQNNKTDRIQGLGFMEFTLAKGLKLRSSFGGYINNTKTKNFYPTEVGYGYSTNGSVTHAATKVTNWINENILSYNRTFNKVHTLSAVLGLTFEQTKNDRLSVNTQDLSLDNLDEESLKYGQLLGVPANSLYNTSMMSGLARVNYSYKNRYLFTASIRADGSSIFPEGNKFSYFPSGAFAWKANEESFLKDTRWIDILKLRLSYGQTGNQRVGALSALAAMGTYYYSFNSKPGGEAASLVQGQAPSSIGNDLLKWETTTQYNAGIDFTVLKGRLSLTVDAYYKDTRDLLITEQLPSISGFQSAVRNIGRVSNKGMEFMVSSVNIEKKDFNWTTDLNISFNRNVVEEIGNGDRIAVTPDPLIMDAYSDVFYVREGYPLGAMFGYVWDGVYQLRDFKEFYDAAGNFITDPALQKQIYNQGSFTLRDGVVENGYTVPKPGGFKPRKIGSSDTPVNSDEDRVYLGSTEPLFFGGITNSFTWKNWYLNIQCVFSYGNKLFNANNRLLQGRNNANISRSYYENFWSLDRQDGTMPAINDEGMKVASTMQVEDASYFKIKDVTLAYTLPRKWVQSLGVKNIRAYVSAKNLLTFTKYSWYDPEYVHPNPLMSGLDRYSYPTTVTLMCGVSLTF